MAVHTFGIPFDTAALVNALQARGLRTQISVIEDACEALGAEVKGRKAGSIGDVGLFAFYPNKQITTGEGGMLVTSDPQIAAKATRLRNQGRDPALGWDQHSEVGFSYRISDINCTLGISQLSRIEAIIARRQQLAEMYDRELAAIPEIVRPPLRSKVGRISWFVYPVQLPGEFTTEDRDRICDAMQRKGIATGRYLAPLHRQPVLRDATTAFTTEDTELHTGNATEEGQNSLSNTEFVADRVIQLPFFNELTAAEIQEVCAALAGSLHELRRKT